MTLRGRTAARSCLLGAQLPGRLPAARVSPGFTVDGCSRTFESNVPWRLVDAAGAELASGSTLGGGVDGPGPTGSDASADAGQSWSRFDSASFDTVDCAGGWVCLGLW